ncbi:MAG TPA: SGNH/GDSL hydrolase family protein [Actinomycetota bacterium]|nr:SGNH/GDSL hydrolase family protein [Actinomycetota bacterium]
MLKTVTIVAASTVGVVAVVLGVEVWLALTREYLPTAPALQLGGTFGPEDGRPLRFVVLGDSTAAGLGAGSPEDAYATVLAERLGRDEWRVELLAFGVSGARVRDVREEQVALAVAAEPDLVFVGIGANDTTHLTSLADVERDMDVALERLVATGATIVVAGPPDMRAAAWLEPLRTLAGWRGRRVAAVIAGVAERHDVPVVPLAEKTGPYFASHPEDAYATDDFHPGPGGYRAWADAIYPVLTQALASPR